MSIRSSGGLLDDFVHTFLTLDLAVLPKTCPKLQMLTHVEPCFKDLGYSGLVQD